MRWLGDRFYPWRIFRITCGHGSIYVGSIGAIMTKNKYYIGQRVRVIRSRIEFEIGDISMSTSKELDYSGNYMSRYYKESELELELEPLPEKKKKKKKIVLWQWLVRGPIGLTEMWSTENSLYEKDGQYIKTGATKEVEI